MAEYIEREAVLTGIEKRVKNPVIIRWLGGIISEQPAADVVPVVHGRWIEHEFEDEPCYGTEYECSVCHKYDYDNPKYCPNCGARMDGE